MTVIIAFAFYVIGLFNARVALQAELLIFVLYRVISRRNFNRKNLALAPGKIYRIIKIIKYKKRRLFIIKIKKKHKEAKALRKKEKAHL